MENLLQQVFQTPTPNRCWAGDILYIRTTSGMRYLAAWIDLLTLRVIDLKPETLMDYLLVIEAQGLALGHRKAEANQLLIHTDQGSQ